MILPPKRWQRSDDCRYDPIRHHAWFARLEKRKSVIPQMEQAYVMLGQDGGTMRRFASEFGLRERDFQDFIQFKDGYSRHSNLEDNLRVTYQKILDEAYQVYSYRNGIVSVKKSIELIAPAFGIRPRVVCELWEVDPNFYPTDYAK